MKVKDIVDVSVGFVVGGIASMLGGFDKFLVALLLSMAFDIVLGCMCAGLGVSKHGTEKIQSRSFIKGIAAKIYELILVAVSVQVDIVLGTSFCRNGVVVAFLCGEIISITENGGLLGVPIPKPIAKALEIMNRKVEDEFEEDNL